MPAITFNADEAFGLAEQIERNGAAFYRKCAGIHTSASDLFNRLAAMEDGHLQTFQSMHTEVSGREAETAADPDSEAPMYLAAMAGGYVFDTKKDPGETITGNESIEDIIKIAIGLEKDSIVFYLGLKEMMRKAGGKDKVDNIIAEEMKHITWLSGQLK
jgi:rubrerythrin